MAVTETGTRARQPDSCGHAPSSDGLRIYYEVFGSGSKTLVFLPANAISHSRLWKAQVHYLARHFRVVTYDGRGNGHGDVPEPGTTWSAMARMEDCLAAMDATQTRSAYLVGICGDGVFPSVQLAATHPERVLGIVAIAAGLPYTTPRHPNRTEALAVFDKVLDSHEGWFKFNEHYIRTNYADFLQFFFGEMFPEPHSTKQVEDAVAYGLDGSVETMLADEDLIAHDKDEVVELCRHVRCPVLAIHGTQDNCQLFERSEILVEATGGRLVKLEGSGHIPNARHPVVVNSLIREFVEGGPSQPPRRTTKK